VIRNQCYRSLVENPNQNWISSNVLGHHLRDSRGLIYQWSVMIQNMSQNWSFSDSRSSVYSCSYKSTKIICDHCNRHLRHKHGQLGLFSSWILRGRMGFNAIEVIGFPSNFWNCTGYLRVRSLCQSLDCRKPDFRKDTLQPSGQVDD
jgi:hypothetical protein